MSPSQIDGDRTTVHTSKSPKKKKKEEEGSNFKCNYSGQGKLVSEVFDDKFLQGLQQNGWGGGGEKFPPKLGGT